MAVVTQEQLVPYAWSLVWSGREKPNLLQSASFCSRLFFG